MTNTLRTLLATLTAALLLAAPVTGHAKKSSKDKRAKEHFQKGETAYAMGKFDEAVSQYEKAYELSRHPALLFNLAQAHRKAGNAETSLHLYKTYLRQQPDAPNAGDVEKLIAELQAELDSGGVASAPSEDGTETLNASPPPQDDGEESSAGTDVAAVEPSQPAVETTDGGPLLTAGGYVSIAIAVVGVGSAVLGAVFLSKSASASDEITSAASTGGPWTPELQDKYSGGQTDEQIGIATLAAGGGLVILATTLFVLTLPDDSPTVAVVPTQDGAMGVLTLPF